MIRIEAVGQDGRSINAVLELGPRRAAIPRSRWSDDVMPATVEAVAHGGQVFFHGGKRTSKSEAFARMAEALRGGAMFMDVPWPSPGPQSAFRTKRWPA